MKLSPQLNISSPFSPLRMLKSNQNDQNIAVITNKGKFRTLSMSGYAAKINLKSF